MSYTNWDYSSERGECTGSFYANDVQLFVTYVFTFGLYADCEGTRIQNLRIVQVMHRGGDLHPALHDNDIWAGNEEEITEELERLIAERD